MKLRKELGATLLNPNTTQFVVWAPLAENMEVHIISPKEKYYPLQKQNFGYFIGVFENVPAGSLYYFVQNGKDRRPDPASHYMPQGVFGPSEVIDQKYNWTDQNWKNIPLRHYVIYELHVGTFSKEGTFPGIIPHLDELKNTGINAIEIMPISQFSGNRNWGYDGVLPYAVQNTYGRPKDLKELINTCHQKDIAVLLDVVYNHLGPEGNWMHEYGHYFTDHYYTPWGKAINFDGPHSDEVKNYFVQNALYWFKNFHFDGLRLDAVQTIMDISAQHILNELSEKTLELSQKLEKPLYLIGECDLNNERFALPNEKNGLGLDSQWNDDFHHALHAILTEENKGYYQDFGSVSHLAKSYQEGFVYTGEYSKYRKKSHGKPALHSSSEKFIIFSQNHDQIGNRAFGERLYSLIGFEKTKLAFASVIFSPFIPLLFMGEEYGETAPFQYFVSHKDKRLIEAVRKGRREEFKSFDWEHDIPFPDDEATFLRSKLNHDLKNKEPHKTLLKFNKDCLKLSQHYKSLNLLEIENLNLRHNDFIIELSYENKKSHLLILLNYSDKTQDWHFNLNRNQYQNVLDSEDQEYNGSGKIGKYNLTSKYDAQIQITAYSAVVYESKKEETDHL